jgi:hypothetical protein
MYLAYLSVLCLASKSNTTVSPRAIRRKVLHTLDPFFGWLLFKELVVVLIKPCIANAV